MREETKAVKKLLCELWTNNKFYIRFKKKAVCGYIGTGN